MLWTVLSLASGLGLLLLGFGLGWRAGFAAGWDQGYVGSIDERLYEQPRPWTDQEVPW